MTDAPSYEIIAGDTTRGLLLLADHATNIVPDTYDSLGLDPESFSRHIAYDIGVEPLTRKLAASLGVPAVMSRFSRLLIDPNRGEDDPTLIMKLSDGAIIPGNHPLSDTEREHRLQTFYRPYHNAIARTLAQVANASAVAPIVISLHSYTPVWKGVPRPWHAAVLWDNDARIAHPLIEGLSAGGDLLIGDNEPYDGALAGDTMYRHCLIAGIAHALIEVRQDLIGHEAGVDEWTGRLAPLLSAINDRADLHSYSIHPSRTGPYPEQGV